MHMTTFASKFHFHSEKSGKSQWKVGLYVANLVYALFLIQYGRFFPVALTITSSIIVIGLFLYTGFTQLKHLGDDRQVLAYIKGHEEWVLVLLSIVLITGTVSYVSWQTRLNTRAIANSKFSSVSQFNKANAEQTGFDSSSPTPRSPAFQSQPALPSAASTPAPLYSDPPAPAIQATGKPQPQRNHALKRNHIPATHCRRPRHSCPHAQTAVS